jgi:hypothetical protein
MNTHRYESAVGLARAIFDGELEAGSALADALEDMGYAYLARHVRFHLLAHSPLPRLSNCEVVKDLLAGTDLESMEEQRKSLS